MDLRHDNLTVADTGIPGGAAVDSIASAAKNFAAGIRNKAKAKKAQKISDGGNYWTLTAFQKSLIKIPQYILDQVGGQGITENAVLNLPAQTIGGTNAGVIEKLKSLSGLKGGAVNEGGIIGGTASDEKTLAGGKMKGMIPYIIGVVVIIGVIWFINRKK